MTFTVRFPREGARPAAQRTIEAMGIGLASLPSLRLDDEVRPGKLAAPACFPVDPPVDVRLSLPSDWGGGDWRSLLRELGCVAHASHVASAPFEFRLLGHAATAEGLANLFAGLADDPSWIRRHTLLTETEIEAQLAGAALRQLFVARRAAAIFLFDRERLEGSLGDEDVEEAYREAMERAFLFEVGSEEVTRFLADRDEPFATAAPFLATLLSASLAEGLVEAHGESWWEKAEAGATLVGLWRQGRRSSAEELARAGGRQGLEIGPLVRSLSVRLAPLLVPPREPVEVDPVDDDGEEDPLPPVASLR